MKSLGRKISFISSIFLSLLCVSTAAVSTFAWFQATANVNITATSTSTTITVAKPDEYIFYAYRGNGNSSYIAENGKTFNDDFVTLRTAEDVETYTTFNEMSPGDLYVFAIGVKAKSNVNLTLNKIISNNAEKQGLTSNRYRRETNGTTYPINIGYAMDIFVQQYTPTNDSYPTGYSSFVTSTLGSDIFSYVITNTTDRNTLDASDSSSNHIITLSNPINFYNAQNLTTTNDFYLMWSVYYSTEPSLLYKEVNNTGAIQYEEPASGDRYFQQDNSGNSNCFGNLTFALSEFSLVIS